MLSRKKLILIVSGLMLFLAGCSNRSSSVGDNPLTRGLESLGISITGLLGNDSVVLGFMFVAMLFGTFAMFKALLRFSFRESGQFRSKEINVIAFMISFIGTVGIFYMFQGDTPYMIHLFGGFAGLFLVIFLIIFLMMIMKDFGDQFLDEDGFLGRGFGWIASMLVGAILSSYLLLGYISEVLEGLGCRNYIESVYYSGDPITTSGTAISGFSCTGDNATLFIMLGNFVAELLPWFLVLGIIFGAIAIFGKKGDDDDDYNYDGSGGLFGSKKKKRNEHQDEELDNIKEMLTDMVKSIGKVDNAFRDKQENIRKLGTMIKPVNNSNSQGGEAQ